MISNKYLFLFILITYIFLLFFFAVLSREPSAKNPVRIDLFWSYTQPRVGILKDNLLNIALFIPIGILICLIADRYRMGKTLFVGLFVSMVIEFSQLIWKRGVFDVDDLFNNVVGAVVGGLIVVLGMKLMKKITEKNNM